MEEEVIGILTPHDFVSGQQAPPTRAFILVDLNNNRIPPRDSLVRLAEGYALALLTKLEKARSKYGYEEDGWMEEGWQQHCASELLRHVDKGDPLDVGAYTAFQWFHKWSTTPSPAVHEVVSRCARVEAQLAAAEARATAMARFLHHLAGHGDSLAGAGLYANAQAAANAVLGEPDDAPIAGFVEAAPAPVAPEQREEVARG